MAKSHEIVQKYKSEHPDVAHRVTMDAGWAQYESRAPGCRYVSDRGNGKQTNRILVDNKIIWESSCNRLRDIEWNLNLRLGK